MQKNATIRYIFLLGFYLLLWPCAEAFGQNLWKVRDIHIEGNKRTYGYIIRRELDFSVGDTIAPTDTAAFFSKNANQIFNTNLFVEVKMRSVAADSVVNDSLPQRLIIIHLHERWYTFPFPIIELADRSFNEWWYNRNADLRRINYGIRLVQDNCRGRNERLKLTMQWGFTHKLEASYLLPYFSKNLNDGLQIGISYITNNNIAYATEQNKQVFFKNDTKRARSRFSTQLSYLHRQGLFATHHYELGWARNSVVDTIAKLNPNYFGDNRTRQSYGFVSYNYVHDRRDRRAFALKGHYLSFEAEKWGLLKNDNLQSGAVRGVASVYLPLGKNWFAAARTEIEWLFTPNLPYYNYKSMGYDMRVVRGYEKYVVEGRLPLLVKTSLRKKLWQSVLQNQWKRMPRQFKKIPIELYLQAHNDLGYVQQNDTQIAVIQGNTLANEWLGGTGLGLTLVTFYNVVLRAEYSLNLRGERGTFFYIATDI